MSSAEPLIRSISDTALWAALYRAKETERPDAVFRDPFARRLAGERGQQIAAALYTQHHDWSWTTRTYLFDHFITQEIAQGTDMVVNLAAGLDARPYRMDLPASLQWVEVDLPELLDYKEKVLTGEKPRCQVERVRLDLAQTEARGALFQQLGSRARRILILTEGLLIYLTTEQVATLATQLAGVASMQRWVCDLASPGLLRMLQRQMGGPLSAGGARLQFAPQKGPDFFRQYGWEPREVPSMLKTAARLKRLRLWMRLLALLPDSQGRKPERPWGGICLLARS